MYASPQYSPYKIPNNLADDTALVHFSNGAKVEYSSEQVVEQSQQVWEKLKNSTEDEHPIFMSLDLETP